MNGARLLIVGTLLLIAGGLSAQDGYSDSFSRTLLRLEEQRASPQFADFLDRAVVAAPDLDALDQLVADHLPHLSRTPRRAEVLVRIGRVYELAHRIDRARLFYSEAARILPENDRIGIRFAAVSVELGNTQEAIIALSRIVNNPDSAATQRSAAVLRARAFYLNGEVERAILHAQSLAGMDLPPETATHPDVSSLFLLGDLLKEAGRETLYQELQERIRLHYPDAPETALISDERTDTVRLYPTPSRLAFTGSLRTVTELQPDSTDDAARLDAAEERPDVEEIESGAGEETRTVVAGVQTGSFRDAENAQYMARDIEAYGFSTEIREVAIGGENYFRVIVPVSGDSPEDAQALVVELKERGVEGFLIFEY
ncbi:MAG: SPOR domain-containing protein [Spirochaeta sp.]|jgi:tetratricopeptide (TPR) repeat protein|nr:SPOR domain-containing protein [Spirochaeta sp.]